MVSSRRRLLGANVRQSTAVQRLINTFRRQYQVPQEKNIAILLDGEPLGVEQTVKETEIAEWDEADPVVLEMHVR
jgi:hypothetical protein